MKLRNKITGEIVDLRDSEQITIPVENREGEWYEECYNSIAELNEDWEDYRPKERWFISEFGKVYSVEGTLMDKQHKKWLKEIGNYFETKEEAEKAVEKLKSWKRLNDKGFRFTGINDKEESQPMIHQCGVLCEIYSGYRLSKDEDFILFFGD